MRRIKDNDRNKAPEESTRQKWYLLQYFVSSFYSWRKVTYETTERAYAHVFKMKNRRRSSHHGYNVDGGEEKSRKRARMKRGDRDDGDSVSCGHGPSGRTIFYYRIHLSSLSSMRESLAWKLLALLINGWRDKSRPRSKRIDGEASGDLADIRCLTLLRGRSRRVE